MDKIVRYEIDLANPRPLTEAQMAEIAALKARPESDMDYSDIPPLDEKFWKNAVRNPYHRRFRQHATLSIETDLLDWFRRTSDGEQDYQTRINSALREYVEREEDAVAQSAAE